MYGPERILAWLEGHVKSMRRSRRKTLAAVVAAAMRMKGVGVLALGRAMAGVVGAKHCIKRVWRFLRNDGLETEEVSRALLEALCPARGHVVVLVDWTDLDPFQQLVFALPRDGRALPFLSMTIRKDAGEGAVVAAEQAGLTALARICPAGRRIVVVADRGFGHTRWLRDVQNWGGSFVQRIPGFVSLDTGTYGGLAANFPVRRGDAPSDQGSCLLSDKDPLPIRLVTTFATDAKEPWLLVTDLQENAAEIVRIYQRRMWIEAAFRDLKNRNWGLGLDATRLSEPDRHDRLFAVLALAYAFLCAFGAAAETMGVDNLLKANTSSERVMSLARIGNYFLQLATCSLEVALLALQALPP